MAAPTRVGSPVNTVEAGVVTSYTVTLPASPVTGNILIAILSGGSITASPSIYSMSGWNEIDEIGNNGANSSECSCAAYWRLVDGTEASTYEIVSTGAGAFGYTTCIEINGADSSSPIHLDLFDESTGGGTSTLTAGEVTTTAADCYVLAGFNFKAYSAKTATISGTGWVELLDQQTGAGSSDVNIYVAEKTMSGTGGTVDAVMTPSSGNVEGTWFQIAIQPTSDAVAPNLSLPTSASIDHRSVTLGATTDEANGTAHCIITASGDQSAPTNQEIIDGGAAEELFQLADATISSTGAFTFAANTSLEPGTSYGYAIVHEDTAGNEDSGSRVEGTFTTSAAFAGSSIYSGLAIPSNSIAFITSGTMTATDDASTPDRLTDSSKSFTVDALIGLQAFNVTDVSFATITDNAATTVDGNLAGGSDNSWDEDDAYQILLMIDNPDVFYYETTTTVSSESASFDYYILDDSTSTYSDTATATINATGSPDGNYTVSLDTLGVPTLTPVEESTASGGAPIIHQRRNLTKKKKQKRVTLNNQDYDVRAAIAELYGDG